jgi:hypothetical protein
MLKEEFLADFADFADFGHVYGREHVITQISHLKRAAGFADI